MRRFLRRLFSKGNLVMLLACGFVAGQLYFILDSGLTSAIELAKTENTVALQGFDPSVPQHERQDFAGAEVDGQESMPTLGGIPVAFGENAPAKLPARLGMPRGAGIAGDAQLGIGGAPGAGGVPGARRPGKPGRVEVTPGAMPGVRGARRAGKPKVLHPKVSASGMLPGRQNAPADPYREALVAIYYLDQAGGEYELTPMQARHLLRLITQAEQLKGAVPECQKKILETLSESQLSFARSRLSAAAAEGKRTSPDLVDSYAGEVLRLMSEE